MRGSRSRPARNCGRSPACATSARTSAGPRSADEVVRRRTSAELGSASTRRPTTTRPWQKIQETVDGYPGLYRDVLTYLRERIKEVLTGASADGRGAAVRSRPCVLRAKAKEVEEVSPVSPGVVDLQGRAPRSDVPQVEVALDVAEAAAVRAEARRRPPAASTLVAGEGRRDVRRRPSLRRRRVGRPDRRGTVSPTSQSMLLDTLDGRRSPLRDVADVAGRSDAERDPAGEAVAPDRRQRATWRAAIWARSSTRVEDRVDGVIFPLGYHTELLGEAAELDDARTDCSSSGSRPAVAIFLLLQAAFGSFRPAVLTFLLLPFALVGGVIAVRLSDGVLSLGSLVGFLTVFGIAARNGIMMVSHFQRLELGGRRLRSGPGAARRPGTVGADPDDGAGHRTGLGAVGRRRQHARPRDRAPDGRRDSRRAGHLDPAQPVRPARRSTCDSARAGSTTDCRPLRRRHRPHDPEGALIQTNVPGTGLRGQTSVAGGATWPVYTVSG